jgi:hypothetical protein
MIRISFYQNDAVFLWQESSQFVGGHQPTNPAA